MVKILNLVLYSDTEYYNNMYNILSNYYNKFDNVKTYFYKYDNTIKNDIELHGDIYKIKGIETYVPGILNKTLKIFKYLEKEAYDYDYIIRTNISTIIDFKLMSIELEKNPIPFYGSIFILCLKWLDINAGIIDTKYYNSYYAAGTNIILSKKGYKLLLDNVHLIDFSIIDDLSIGVLFKTLNINYTNIAPNKYISIPIINNINELNSLIEKNYIAYRNRNDVNRNIDVIQMKMITDLLSQKFLEN